MRARLFFMGMFCVLASLPALAQTDPMATFKPDSGKAVFAIDTTQPKNAFNPPAKNDTLKKASYWGKPQKAALYSAILPGAGQVYNHEAWKLPIIYSGIGILGYFIVTNNVQYVKFNSAVNQVADDKNADPIPGYTQQQLILGRDYYRRNRDYSIILTTLFYLLQIADAHVFAHLRGFNVNDDLTLQPTVLPMYAGSSTFQQQAPGLQLTLRLK
jgi:hypothetical protein